MALVALTDEQRSHLGANPRFISLVEFAILDYSTYWINQDGTTIPPAELIHWAKSRQYASNVIIRNVTAAKNPEYVSLSLTFLDMPVYDNAFPYDENTVIDFMVGAGTFDTLAGKVFDSKIKEILF